MLNVTFHPFELLVSQRAQSPRLQIQHVHQSDEVHTLLVEAVPTGALTTLSVALQELLAVIVEHVVLARNIKYVFGCRAFQDLIDRIKLFWFREMADIAGMQHELGGCSQTVNFVHRRLQCPRDIRIGRFIESHVAVADLYEAQLTRSRCLVSRLGHLTKAIGLKYTALHDAESPSPRPCHAFQESPPVYSILVVIM